MRINLLIDRLRLLFTQNLMSAGLHKAEPGWQSRRAMIWFTYISSILANLIAGVYLTGFWLSFGADSDRIGTLVLLISLVSLLQIVSPFLFDRVRNIKRAVLIMRVIQHVIHFGLASFISLSGLPDPTIIRIQFGLAAVSYALGAISNPAMQRWHIKNLPEEKRLGFYAFVHASNSLILFVILFAAGLLTDLLKATIGDRLTFAWFRFALLLPAILDVWVLSRIDDPPDSSDAPKSRHYRITDLFSALRRQPIYLLTMAVGMSWAFSASLPGQYFVVYLIEDLGYSYSLFSSVSLINLAVIILFTTAWKRVISRLNWIPAFALSMILYSVAVFIIAMVRAGTLGVILYIGGSVWAYIAGLGVNLSFSNIVYINMPNTDRTLYIAWFNFSYHGAVLLGVAVGKLYMSLPGRLLADSVFPSLNKPQILQLSAALAILISGLFVRRISKRIKRSAPTDANKSCRIG